MTTLESSVRGDRARSVDERRPLGSIRFDWVAAILGLWLMFGTYLDGWHRPDALLRGAALLPAVIGMTLIVQPLSFMVQLAILCSSHGRH